MRPVAVAVVGCLVGLVAGQEQPKPADVRVAEVCRYIQADALARFDAGQQISDVRRDGAAARLSDVLSRWGRDRGPASRPRQVESNGQVVHAHGRPEIVQAAERAVAQLLREHEVVRARVQCSVVRVPRAVADEAGLKVGAVSACDEATVSRLARAAVRDGGQLRNLPEVVAEPLRPLAIENASKDPAMSFRVRAELIPVERTAALLGLHVVRGELPANLNDTPQAGNALLASPVLALEAGGLSLVVLPEREAVTVLVVRCVEIGTAVGQPQPPSPPLRR